MSKNSCLLLLVVFCALSQGMAQHNPFGNDYGNDIKRSPIRKILNKFSLGVGTGFGRTYYSHDLDDFALVEKGEQLYIIDKTTFNATGTNQGYTNWVSDAQVTNSLLIAPGDVVSQSDTANLTFRGIGNNIPLSLTLHLNLFIFRLGGGVTAEYATLPDMLLQDNPSPGFGAYQPRKSSSLQTRYFGIIGAKVYDFWDYSFAVDMHIGKLNRGSAFNKAQIDKASYMNLGISIEKNFSEYFRLTVRPSYDMKKYNLLLPESGLTVQHKQPALYVNVGVSFNYAEVPRCKIDACRTQLKHVHYGKEFRGQPITKKQNPKYGENHPTLLRYKGKNKKKINPF